jgi:hypothetical protein
MCTWEENINEMGCEAVGQNEVLRRDFLKGRRYFKQLCNYLLFKFDPVPKS